MRKLLDKFLSPYYFSRPHNFLRIESEHILKLHEERPDIVDAIKNREIQLVINTPSGKLSKYDDSYIRKSAVKYQVLYITTTAAAMVTGRGIDAYKSDHGLVKSLQSYHMDINRPSEYQGGSSK